MEQFCQALKKAGVDVPELELPELDVDHLEEADKGPNNNS
jgi:hypothetical protein